MYPSKMVEDILYRSISYSDKETAIFIPLWHRKNQREAKELRTKWEVHHSDLRRINHGFRKPYNGRTANLPFPFLTIENDLLCKTLHLASAATLPQHLASKL